MDLDVSFFNFISYVACISYITSIVWPRHPPPWAHWTCTFEGMSLFSLYSFKRTQKIWSRLHIHNNSLGGLRDKSVVFHYTRQNYSMENMITFHFSHVIVNLYREGLYRLVYYLMLWLRWNSQCKYSYTDFYSV